MIIGRVVKSQAIGDAEIEGTSGTISVAAVIDTGYNGSFTLPGSVIRSLRLPFLGHRGGRLANGARIITKTHRGVVHWMGELREVLLLS
jgi:predicted aspartyl protease